MLISLILFPLFSFLFVFFLPRRFVYSYGILSSLFSFIWLVLLGFLMDFPNTGFQFVFDFPWWPGMGLGLTLGVDWLSYWLALLTTFLILICFIICQSDSYDFPISFSLLLYLTHSLLLGVFFTLNLFWFFFLFESVIIPVFFIISIWGSRKEKRVASLYFLFYTLAGSILFLFSIVWLYMQFGTLDYELLLVEVQNLDTWVQNLLWVGFGLSFATKIPIVPVHLWLPQAHVEAPLPGSVLLAGILLKLGGYGFIRFSLPFFPDSCSFFSSFIICLSILAVFWASLTTLRQVDLKRAVAYSSVAHMGLVTAGIFLGNLFGYQGAFLLMLAHGIVSPALFISVTVLYHRYGSRNLLYYRGLVLIMPIFAILFFLFTLANLGFPLSGNFVSELLVLLGSVYYSLFSTVGLGIGLVLSAAYSLFIYGRVIFGSFTPRIIFGRDFTVFEFFSFFPFLLSIIFLGVFPGFITGSLE